MAHTFDLDLGISWNFSVAIMSFAIVKQFVYFPITPSSSIFSSRAPLICDLRFIRSRNNFSSWKHPMRFIRALFAARSKISSSILRRKFSLPNIRSICCNRQIIYSTKNRKLFENIFAQFHNWAILSFLGKIFWPKFYTYLDTYQQALEYHDSFGDFSLVRP